MTVFFQRGTEAVADAGSAQPGLLESDPGRVRATLRLTPHGKLVFEDRGDAPDLDARIALRLCEAFARGTGEGLWRLGALEAGAALPPVFVWWREFAFIRLAVEAAARSRRSGTRKIRTSSAQ